jgi:dipeptidase E
VTENHLSQFGRWPRERARNSESVSRQIIAIGGGVFAPDTGNRALERYILDVSGKPRPRVLFVGTASGDDLSHIARFYESYAALDCTPSHLTFLKRTPPDLRALVFAHDVVHVGGGNTRSMLAIWREWEFDTILRGALEQGVLLCGSSAGSICWFEEGVTDSIAGDLTRMSGLGFLGGSNCPHYDGEPARRPAYQRMVAAGVIGAGYAADDGVGLHFVDGALHAIVNSRPNATAYRVERDGDAARETRLGARAL